jgi:hypothetical protein
VVIEQHVRTDAPDDIVAAWGRLPDGITATDPVQREPPTEVGSDMWRVRWQSEVTANIDAATVVDSPRHLPIVSRLREREIARTHCTLIARRRSGVSAPSLVHFGRLSPTTSVRRRIQLRALDNRPFVVSSVATRDGGVEAVVTEGNSQPEHWIEVRATVFEGTLDDVLTIETDHPASPSLRVAVKGTGPQPRAR